MRVLIYGTGPWAEVHANALKKIPRATIVGVCGHSNVPRLDAFVARYNIPAKGMNLRAMVDTLRPEMVDIVVSPVCRVEAVRASVAQCVKVINIEKPWALWPEDAYDMCQVVKSHGIKLVVNHQKKFLPAWKTLWNLIEQGSIGDIVHVRGTCRGNPAEQGTHIVDSALRLGGTRVTSWTIGQVGELEGLREPHAAPNAALAAIQLSNGVRLDLSFGSWGWKVAGETEAWSNLGFQIAGTKGIADLGLTKGLTVKYFDGTSPVLDGRGWIGYYLEAERDHLASVIDYGLGLISEHDSDVSSALPAFETIVAMYQSALSGGLVQTPCRFTNTIIDRLRLRMPLSVPVEVAESSEFHETLVRSRWFPMISPAD